MGDIKYYFADFFRNTDKLRKAVFDVPPKMCSFLENFAMEATLVNGLRRSAMLRA